MSDPNIQILAQIASQGVEICGLMTEIRSIQHEQ
jgi:hypothetical protein